MMKGNHEMLKTIEHKAATSGAVKLWRDGASRRMKSVLEAAETNVYESQCDVDKFEAILKDVLVAMTATLDAERAENAELRRQLEELKLAFTAQGGKFEDEKAADRLATLRLQRGYVGGVGFRPV